MYDSPTPFPANKNVQSSVIPLCDTWFCDTQSFENTIGPYVYSLQAYGKIFDELKREYGSLMFSIMELVNGLYINVDTEFWTKGSCIGTNYELKCLKNIGTLTKRGTIFPVRLF